MHPVLAFGLVAVAGLAATRLPRRSPPPRRPPTVAVLLAAGTPLVLLGLLLGPGIELLAPPVLHALAPVTALAVGWIGAAFGARFEWRVVRRVPRQVWLLVALQSAAALVVVGLGAWLLTRLVPALAAVWTPPLPAILALAAMAAVSGPDAMALVIRAVGVRRPVARTLGRTAMLDTAFGLLAITLGLALYPPAPREAAAAGVLAWPAWLGLAVASGGVAGALFLGLTHRDPGREPLGLWLFGVLLFGAGAGYAADLSPFVVCALAGAMIVNLSPLRRRVLAALHAWEPHMSAILLVVAGALLTVPTAWILLAVFVLAVLRVAARWAAVRYGREPLGAAALPPHFGLAAVPQAGLAVALAIAWFIGSGTAATEGGGGGGGSAVVTTMVLGVALAQGLAPFLLGLALRPARLTGAARAAEVT